MASSKKSPAPGAPAAGERRARGRRSFLAGGAGLCAAALGGSWPDPGRAAGARRAGQSTAAHQAASLGTFRARQLLAVLDAGEQGGERVTQILLPPPLVARESWLVLSATHYDGDGTSQVATIPDRGDEFREVAVVVPAQAGAHSGWYIPRVWTDRESNVRHGAALGFHRELAAPFLRLDEREPARPGASSPAVMGVRRASGEPLVRAEMSASEVEALTPLRRQWQVSKRFADRRPGHEGLVLYMHFVRFSFKRTAHLDRERLALSREDAVLDLLLDAGFEVMPYGHYKEYEVAYFDGGPIG